MLPFFDSNPSWPFSWQSTPVAARFRCAHQILRNVNRESRDSKKSSMRRRWNVEPDARVFVFTSTI